MTIPLDTADYNFSSEPGEIDDFDADGGMAPVPVFLAKTVTRQEAPHFGSWTSITVPVAGVQMPIPLMQRRVSRCRSFIKNPAPLGTTATQETQGVVTTATPGQTIATLNVPAGTETVNWNIILAGTLLAADRNNLQVVVNGAVVAVSNNGINTGTVYPQATLTKEVLPAGGGVIQVQAIGAATGGAIYAVMLSADATGAQSSTIIVSESISKLSGLAPQGYGIAPGEREEYLSQQPVYGIVPAGGVPTVVYVLDQAWENVDNDDYTDSGH
jgi:hypothetical protein